MASKFKKIARRRHLSMIAAESTTAITATFDAKVAIIAAAPATDPNPAAKLDNPDADGSKTTPPPGNPNNGTMTKDNNGNPPRPRFTMTAYNGGPMKLSGYRFPVIVDGAGLKAAAAKIPIYVGHTFPDDSPETQMNRMIGQSDSFQVDQATGELSCGGAITGESELICQAMAHAKNGFQWQASIGAMPSQIDFIPEGQTSKVNGRSVSGPMVIARAVTCNHIALVPLGADVSTTAKIAASAAKGKDSMEFAAWLLASYSMDASKLTPDQDKKFKAEFGRIAAQHDGGATTTTVDAATVAPIIAGDNTIKIDTAAAITAHRKAMSEEQTRISAVMTAAKEFPEISAKAVSEGWNTDKTELEVLRASRKAMETDTSNAGFGAISASALPKDGLQMQLSHPSRGGRHEAKAGRIGNELAAVIETAGLISAGYSAERLSKNPAYGVRVVEGAERAMSQFGRGLGPMGLMRMAARFAGISLPENKDDAYQSIVAEFSTLNLPTIFSNLMNKFLLDSYNAVDPDWIDGPMSGTTAWQKFCKKGPVQDFKPHYRLRLTGDLEFKDLGPSGEIQSGTLGEQSYSLQASTKAIMFGLTRTDIINDDLSAMSTLPTLFGRGAGVRVAKFIYGLLIAALQSDRSTAFFASSAITTAGNLMQPNLLTGSALSITTLESAEAAFMAQTDPTGQPAGIAPEILLVPPGLINLARQLYQSEMLIPSLASGGNARGVPGKNTLQGRFRPVCSQWLASLTAAQINAVIKGITTTNAGSNSTWFLTAGPQQSAYPLEVGFLNGQEMPIIERNEAQFDRLGINFRGFIDFGANLAEPRSVVKCTA